LQLQIVLYVIIGVFILYRIFLRVRRSVGWQQLNPGKMRLFAAIFFFVGLIFSVEGAFHTVSLISDAVGILIGVILAFYGAVMTRFELRGGSWYYRPNTWIGSIVTLIFFGRLILRIYDMYMMANHVGLQEGLTLTDRMQTVVGGWTAGLLLVMFAYYVVYNMIILRKQKHLPQ
jgi:hypothetical protein